MASRNNQPWNRLYPKKPAGMHWLGYNDAVSWLNEVKTQTFQSTASFENFEIRLPACLPASLPASQPAIRPDCTRYRAPKFYMFKGNGGEFTKMLFQRQFTHCAMAIPFILLSSSLLFCIPLARCESHLQR